MFVVFLMGVVVGVAATCIVVLLGYNSGIKEINK
jgi:hypothetical protein